MSIIKILPEHLVNQIAAGEVVERPASVVKELVENSLDAGAQRIVVEVKDAGITMIKVIDDGKGMSREDAELSLQRHATSKIAQEADLWNIGTMGFRGEALASIASVSKFTVRTRQESDEYGTEVDCEGGDKVRVQDTGMPKGTQIFVRDLFFNTPARKKYLKKESTEMGHISYMMNTIALANHAVAFKLVHNDKTVFDYSKKTDLLSRIVDVFGETVSDAMIPLFYGGTDFKLSGYVGKPLLSRSSSKHQYFFVNGRPIQHHFFANAIKRAYHSMLMENKKPIFVINIEIDPSLIDVNVHPRKTEIRFEDERHMMSVIYNAVKTAVEKVNLMPKGFTESRNYMSDSFPVQRGAVRGGAPSGAKAPVSFGAPAPRTARPRDVQSALEFSQTVMSTPVMPDREAAGIETREPEMSMRPIVQIANSYIVAQNSEGLVLIDQHAAHERVRFEELMDGFEAKEKKTQPLLMPVQLELTDDEVRVVQDNQELFQGMGFEIEHFGGKTFAVQGVPHCLAKEDIDTVVRGVIDDILSGKGGSKFQGKVEEILTYMSCRSAIKFGQSLSMPEMEALIRQMDGLKRPYTCPHGRPTMVSLTLSELEKMFGRK